MASNEAVLQWNANTESDLGFYNILFTLRQDGVFDQTASVGTVTTSTLANFDSDGLWKFALVAVDTSGNVSPRTATLTKRIIRTPAGIVVRR